MSDTQPNTRPMTGPLAAVLIAALALHAIAEEAWHECDCNAAGSDPQCDHYVEMCAKADAVDAARLAIIAANEPRAWDVSANSLSYVTVEAGNVEEAYTKAAPLLAQGNVGYVNAWAFCELTGEIDDRSLYLDWDLRKRAARD